MGKVISAIGSRRDGTVEFMLAEKKRPTEFFIFNMPPEDAFRLARKLMEAGTLAKRQIEEYDCSGFDIPREKTTGCYGQKSNNK